MDYGIRSKGLEDNGYIFADITEKMVAAVGFRNLMVHE